jgi:hypothetical protein
MFVHQVLKFAINLDGFRAVVARNLKTTQGWTEMLRQLQGGTAQEDTQDAVLLMEDR